MLDWPLLIVVMLVAGFILLGFIFLLTKEIREKQNIPSIVPHLIIGVSGFLFVGLIIIAVLVLGHFPL